MSNSTWGRIVFSYTYGRTDNNLFRIDRLKVLLSIRYYYYYIIRLINSEHARPTVSAVTTTTFWHRGSAHIYDWWSPARVTRGGRVSCNNDDDNNNKQSASHTHYHYYYYYYNILVHVIYIYNMHIDISIEVKNVYIHTY